MLTPYKIRELFGKANIKHTEPHFGLYPPQKKIMSYLSRRIKSIEEDNKLQELDKVKEMTNLLEGFVQYLNTSNIILKLDIEKILTYIYYPESEEITLNNKDNLLVGSKGNTVRLWHDAYFMQNREQIINRLIECKNVLYNKVQPSEYRKAEASGMPEQMQKSYEQMLKFYSEAA